MKHKFRCDCPFTSALDVLGDRWMLVIVKLMLLDFKETFKDFMESDEAIASNILSAKLKMLEEFQVITKSKRPDNKKTNYYHLTDKGLALTPVLVELAAWSDGHLRDFHPTIEDGENMEFLRKDKAAFAELLEKRYRDKQATVMHLR